MLNIAEFSERSFKGSHIFRSHQSDHFGKVSLKKEIILRNLLFFLMLSLLILQQTNSAAHILQVIWSKW